MYWSLQFIPLSSYFAGLASGRLIRICRLKNYIYKQFRLNGYFFGKFFSTTEHSKGETLFDPILSGEEQKLASGCCSESRPNVILANQLNMSVDSEAVLLAPVSHKSAVHYSGSKRKYYVKIASRVMNYSLSAL